MPPFFDLPTQCSGCDGMKSLIAKSVLVLGLFAAAPVMAGDAAAGEALTTACAACHGADGKGNQAIGAPNLTDKTWLYSVSQNNATMIEQSIVETVTNGRTGVMPNWKEFLGDAKVHLLAGYVYGASQPAANK